MLRALLLIIILTIIINFTYASIYAKKKKFNDRLSIEIERKKKCESSPERNLTSIPGFKVPCANHYTTGENY